jgi:hypothetical protein
MLAIVVVQCTPDHGAQCPNRSTRASIRTKRETRKIGRSNLDAARATWSEAVDLRPASVPARAAALTRAVSVAQVRSHFDVPTIVFYFDGQGHVMKRDEA